MSKVIINAYACSPYQGSEAAVGWGIITALAKLHELHVIVEEEKFAGEIKSYENLYGKTKNITFYFIKKNRARILRKIWPPSYYWFYRNWQWKAYQLAKKLHNSIHFDIAHQLTMVGFREPGYLWKLPIPFVWGPIGGMGYFPVHLFSFLSVKSKIYYLAYNVVNFFHMNFQLRARAAAFRANEFGVIGLIVASSENKRRVLHNWKLDSKLISEVGKPLSSNENNCSIRNAGEPIRIVWVGLNIPRKALNILILSLARLKKEIKWQLTVVGDGELSYEWKKKAMGLGISKNIIFSGSMPRADALKIISSSHVMAITSLRDLSATVTLEALSFGVPVICPDHCGFSDIIDQTCGIKCRVDSKDNLINDFVEALTRIYKNEGFRIALSRGALKRSAIFQWNVKAKEISDIYHKKLTL